MSAVTAAAADEADEVTNPPSGAAPEDKEEIHAEDLGRAEELKQEGNDHYKAKNWGEALASYRSALGYLPRRRQLQVRSGKRKVDASRGVDSDEEDRDEEPPNVSSTTSPAEREEDVPPPPTESEVQCAKARAVINANIAACFMKLEEHKEVVTACTEALKDDPNYLKALQRRATSQEKLGTWSSLSGAQDDYKKILELLPSTSPEIVPIRRALVGLGPRIEAAQKRETGEMVDKLKGLGNSILGNFGLSTDNFQFVPNGQGGYSMNFVR